MAVRQFGEIVLAISLAPLFTGWIAQCRAWLQNRSAPSIFLPYRTLRKLFHKDAVLAHNASPLGQVFGCWQVPEVHVSVPEQVSPVVSRELLYTAVTRARRKVTIHSSREVVAHAITHRIERASGLRDLLWP